MNKVFICYDGRARGGDTSAAAEIDCVFDGSEDYVRAANVDLIGVDCIWFEYDADDEDNLLNERMRPDLAPDVTAVRAARGGRR